MTNTKTEKILKTVEKRIEPLVDFAINIFGGIFRFCRSVEPTVSKTAKNIGKSTASLSSTEDLIFPDTDNTIANNKVDVIGEKTDTTTDIVTNTDS